MAARSSEPSRAGVERAGERLDRLHDAGPGQQRRLVEGAVGGGEQPRGDLGGVLVGVAGAQQRDDARDLGGRPRGRDLRERAGAAVEGEADRAVRRGGDVGGGARQHVLARVRGRAVLVDEAARRSRSRRPRRRGSPRGRRRRRRPRPAGARRSARRGGRSPTSAGCRAAATTTTSCRVTSSCTTRSSAVLGPTASDTLTTPMCEVARRGRPPTRARRRRARGRRPPRRRPRARPGRRRGRRRCRRRARPRPARRRAAAPRRSGRRRRSRGSRAARGCARSGAPPTTSSSPLAVVTPESTTATRTPWPGSPPRSASQRLGGGDVERPAAGRLAAEVWRCGSSTA